jgi:hypothetical protein
MKAIRNKLFAIIFWKAALVLTTKRKLKINSTLFIARKHYMVHKNTVVLRIHVLYTGHNCFPLVNSGDTIILKNHSKLIPYYLYQGNITQRTNHL